MRINKNIFVWIFAIVIIIISVIWFMQDDFQPIEDTNGPDDYSLTTITDENIIQMDIGSSGLTKSSNIIEGDVIKFSSDNFSGVTEIVYNNYLGKSDVVFDLMNFHVYKGNFKMVVVHNDKIVATLEPDMFVTYRLEDINGTVSLRIAGESAAFEFYMSEVDYEEFAHH